MPTVTIEVPEGLGDIARERGETLEEVAKKALHEWMQETLEEAEDTRIARERWARIESGAEKTLSHDDVSCTAWTTKPEPSSSFV